MSMHVSSGSAMTPSQVGQDPELQKNLGPPIDAHTVWTKTTTYDMVAHLVKRQTVGSITHNRRWCGTITPIFWTLDQSRRK